MNDKDLKKQEGLANEKLEKQKEEKQEGVANEKLEKEKEKKQGSRKKIVKIGIAITVILILLLLLRSCGGEVIEQLPDDVKEIINLGKEETEEGDIKVNKEEIQEELNEEAMKSMLTISMNKVPVFENGKVKGNLNIVNDKNNYYNFFVEIYLKGTDELVYQSKIIEKGTYLEEAKLDKELGKGVYEAIAVFKAVHPENNTLEGQANAEITITIKN